MTLQVFTLPDLGEGLAEAELLRWLVAVGDTIAVDQAVVEVETAKATVEVPSPYGGVVATLHGGEGTVVNVGEPLISVDDEVGTTPATQPSAAPATPVLGTSVRDSPVDSAAAASYVEEERAGSGNVLIGYGTSAAPAVGRGRRGRRSAGHAAVAAPRPAPAPDGSATLGPVAVKSPLVRELARQRGIDLRGLRGTGPAGLITRADVEQAVAPPAASQRLPAAPALSTSPGAPAPPTALAAPAAPTPAAPAAPTPAAPTALAAPTAPAASAASAAGPVVGTDASTDPRTGLAIRQRIPVQGLRRTVARTLTRSRQEIPEATTWVDVDATGLLELRASLSGPDRRGPGLLALVGRFVVAGLARFPELNARVDTDSEQILHLQGVNLGIAAQTERGLVVPSVRDAHLLGARALDAEIRRITAAARDGSASAAGLTSGSFTLNNYGVLGVDGSAAIINYPEVAILGMGRVIPRPWVVDGEIVVRQLTQLSLVFDHRVCDGGTAGGFLRFVADAVESPVSALADL